MRIISGKFKSRKLISPSTNLTRPTSDRARESMFNIIQSLKQAFFEDTSVLDAFAGSGALGFEALSRGAKHVTFIENNPQTAKTIKENIANFHSEPYCTLIVGDATKPPKARHPMHLVFLDPPYNLHSEDVCLLVLQEQGWINNETLIILETSQKGTLKLPPNVQLIDQRRYGAALVTFCRFIRDDLIGDDLIHDDKGDQ